VGFIDIPNFPGYSISRRGEVRGPSGFILQATSRGQVRIKKDGKVRLEYVCDLLLETMTQDIQKVAAQARAEADSAQLAADKAKADQDVLAERLRLARQLNAHLLAMIGRKNPGMDLSDLRIPACGKA